MHRIVRSARFGVAILVVSIGLGIFASASSAALLGGLLPPLSPGPTVPAPQPSTPLIPPLTNLVNGTVNTLTNNIGLGTLGEMVACPVGTTFASLAAPVPGLSDAANAARFTTCMLHFLDFEWRTTHPGPPNPITGDNIITTIGVPTPLNMDSDPVPDMIANVLPLGINKFQVAFRRLITPGDMPGTAALVITDPTGGSLPSSHIALGVDSNGGRMPDSVTITFTLESFTPPLSFTTPPKFLLEINQTPQPQHAGIFADLFDENTDHSNHKSFAKVALGEMPVPSNFSGEVTMRNDKGIDTVISASQRTNVDADAVLNAKPISDGTSRTQHLHALFTDMPTQTTVNYRPVSPTTPAAGATAEQIDAARGGQTVHYESLQALGALDVTYDDFLNPSGGGTPQPKIRAHINLQHIPTKINVSQIGSVMDFDTPGDKIDQIDAQFALNGDLIQLQTPRPGARMLRKKPAPTPTSPAYLGVAGRIKGLHHVHIDQLGGRSVMDIGIDRQPFDIDLRDDISGITATGAIEDLPANAHIEYLPSTPSPDPVSGDTQTPLRFRYDAGGDTIHHIAFKAAFDNTIGTFVDQIEGQIVDLPPVIDVSADMVGKKYLFNSSKPFGMIEALVRNKLAVAANTQPFLTAGSSGASAVIRNNGPFAALGRLYGLKKVSADLGNNIYHLEVGPVPLEIRAEVDQVIVSPPEVLPRHLLMTASNIPSVMDISFTADNDTNKQLIYDASDVIDRIDLSLTGDKLYAPEPRINRVAAGILGVPKHFELGLGNAGNFDIVAGGSGIGGITGLVTSGPDPVFPMLTDQAYVQKDDDAIVAKVQIVGFTEFHLKKNPTDIILKNHVAIPLHAEAWLDLNSGAANDTATGALHPHDTAATLDIKNVPATVHVNFDNASNKIHYDASSRIDQIAAYGRIFQPVGPDLLKRELNASIDGIPTTIDVQISNPDSHHKKIAYDADGQTDGIHAKLTGDKLYAGEPKVNRLQGDILSIPAHLSATLGDAGDFDIDAGTGIGSMTALVTSGPDPTFLPTRHQAYIENGNDIVAKAQLLGFKTFHMSKDPMHVTFGTNQSYPLFAEAHVDADSNGSPETSAKLDIEKVPATMDVNFVNDHHIEYTGSSGIDSITADATVFQDATTTNLQRDLHAEFIGLPSHVVLDLGDPASTEKTITYDANAPITRVALSLLGDKLYQAQTIAGQPAVNKITAEVDNIPAHLAADIKASGALDIDAGAGLGAIKALVTSGPDPAFGANNHQAFVQNNAAGLAAKVQFLGFKHFTYNPAPMKAVLDTTASHPLIVDGLLEQSGQPRTANLTISNIPSHVSFEQNDLTSTRKQYKYSANAPITSLSASLLGPNLYAGQPATTAPVNRIEAHIANIPALMTADIGSDGYLNIDAGAGIDNMTVLATSGPVPAIPANDHVANIEADSTQTVLQAQFLGFKSFTMTPQPLHVNLKTTAAHKLDVAAKLDADNNGSGELLANLTIDKVPDTMDVSLPNSGAFNYDASSAIDAVDFSATNLPGLPAGPGLSQIKTISGNITHIPRHLDASYGSGGHIVFNARSGPNPGDALDGIGSITLGAVTANPPALPGGLAASHVAFRQKGSELAGEVKVSGLRQIDITPTPIDVTVDTDVLAALDVDAAQDANNNGTFEKSVIAKLRSDIHRVTVRQTNAGAGKRIEVDAGNGDNDLELHAVADNLPMGVSTIDGNLTDLPAVTLLTLGSGDAIDVQMGHYVGSTLFTNTNADGIGEINLHVNGGNAPNTYQDDNNNTVSDTDGISAHLNGGNITNAAVKLRGLRGFSFGTSPNTQVGLDFNQTTGHPIALDASVDSKAATGFIDKLPAHMLLDIKPTSDTIIHYSADQRIHEIALSTNWLSPKIEGAIVKVHDLPSDFSVCLNSDGAQADCMPTRAPNGHNGIDESDRLLSVAWESNTTTSGTRPNVNIKACFDASDCNSGKIATLDLNIPRRLELEVGASAHGPNIRGFDCFDDISGVDDALNIPGDIGCMISWPVDALTDIVTTSGAHAFVYFDTGSTNLDGTASYQIPSPTPVLTQPITLTLGVPTLNATDASLEANVNIQDFVAGNGFVTGGSMSCNGGFLKLHTAFGFSLGDFDLPGALIDLVNDVISAYNAIPFTDSIDHISNPIHGPSFSHDIDFDIIPRFC